MENSRLILILLGLSFVLPELAPAFLSLAVAVFFVPNLIRERKRLEFDRKATLAGFRISALPVLTEEKIAEALSSVEGYENVREILERTGKFELPVYGWRSEFLASALKVSLETGRKEILLKAIEDLSRSDEVLSEITSLLSMEKYTLLGSFAAFGVVAGIISRFVSGLTPYLVFQAIVGALWFHDVGDFGWFESLLVVFLLVFAGFEFGVLLG